MKLKELELAVVGHANGLSLHLKNSDFLTKEKKEEIINNAAIKFGEFLDELGVDWENDPNSANTPKRVAKAYVNDLWFGRYNQAPEITAFPADGYSGIVFEGNIPLTSMCSHHHQTIQGKVHIAYIPNEVNPKVIGLSKMNRIVEYFARRGAIQEQLTRAIHNAIDKVIELNGGVAVMIEATHNCVSCRGVKHQGASMITSELNGSFKEDEKARNEFYQFVNRIKR